MAAIRRVYTPGLKFDEMVVLNGGQGIGKGKFLQRLGGKWFSDNVAMTDVHDKTAAEKLQGYWFIEFAELAGMRKADLEKLKAFTSRQNDIYRASYGRVTERHPRQCVFFGTTNNERGYLRDITGNRRFWPVMCNAHGPKKAWNMTRYEVEQIWAEALIWARSDRTLRLDETEEAEANNLRRLAMEEDDREGLVRAYLNGVARVGSVLTDDEPIPRDVTSNMEIWVEAFGHTAASLTARDSYAVSAIMVRIDGWEKTGKLERRGEYGPQRTYRRVTP